MKETTFFVPPEIRRLLGAAPVLSTEDPQHFEQILQHFAGRFPQRQNDALMWSHIWDLAVSRFKLERLNRFETQVLDSACREKVEEAERARAKDAEAERNAREQARLQAVKEARRALQTPDGLPLLGGPALREAKQRLLSALFKRPELCRKVERQGISRHHFRDEPKWQEAFDMVRTGGDIQPLVAKDPTGEIARLWQLADWMSANDLFSLARQIVASVRVEEAPVLQAETEKEQPETANNPVSSAELAAEFDYASVFGCTRARSGSIFCNLAGRH